MNRFIWVLYFTSAICFSQDKGFDFYLEPRTGFGRLNFEEPTSIDQMGGYWEQKSNLFVNSVDFNVSNKYFISGIGIKSLIGGPAFDFVFNINLKVNLIPFIQNKKIFFGPQIQYGLVAPKLFGSYLGSQNVELGILFKYSKITFNLHGGKLIPKSNYYNIRNVRMYYFQLGYTFPIKSEKI